MSEATNAELGYGLLIKMLTSTDPDVYTTLGQMRDVTPSGSSVDTIDATHNDSPNATEEIIPGLIRTGETTFQIHYNPVSSTMTLLMAALRVKKTFREVWPDGRYVTYSGYITNVEPDAPTEDRAVAQITIKRSGPLTPMAAAQPGNVVLPAISGELDAGKVLTAYEGLWANEPTSFTFQWKNASVSLPGAVSKTYITQASDSGDAITVVVTAVNAAGSASAESAPVVIAA